MQKRIIILIDGENISSRRTSDIDALVCGRGTFVERNVYHRRKDPCTRCWTEKSKTGGYKDVCLDGEPEKNKVDRKMQKDARHYLRSPKYDRVCIVTSDGDFRCLAGEPSAEEKLCFIGEKKASKKLRKTCVSFMELS